MKKTKAPSISTVKIIQEEIDRLLGEYQAKKKVLDQERQDIINDFSQHLDAYKLQIIKSQLQNKE